MNTTTATIGAILILLVLFFGGLFLYNQSNSLSPTATSTPTGVTTGTNTQGTSGQAQTVGSPAVTTLPTVTASNLSAAVVGTVVPNGAFTTYWYEYGTSANLGAVTANQSLGSGFESLAAPFYITGLAKDTTYYYRLVAQNAYGKSTGETFTFRTTVGPVVIVGGIPAVKTSAANSVTTIGATVNGEVTPNKAPTTYWFEYGKTNQLGFITTVQSVGDGNTALPASAALTSLEPGTTYYFRLNAQNKFGTVAGSVLTFKTSGQAIVAVPVVTTQLPSPFATTTATLRGTVNPYGTQTSYWFEYSVDPGFGLASLKTTQHKSAGGGSATVSIEQNVSGLKGATTYYYRIVAQNNGGTVKGDTQTFKTK